MDVKGANVQILDLPGIIEGAKDGRGRGRQVIAVARSCNLLFIVLDVLKPLGDKAVIENELEGFGIRLNKVPLSLARVRALAPFVYANAFDRRRPTFWLRKRKRAESPSPIRSR
jgi:small GTP-binding protein